MIREADASKPIVDYLEKNLKKGYKLEDLKWALVGQKHSRIEIEKAIKLVQARMPKERPLVMSPQVEVKKTEIVVPERKGFFRRLFG